VKSKDCKKNQNKQYKYLRDSRNESYKDSEKKEDEFCIEDKKKPNER